jgi:poly(A) polymerase
MKHVETIKPFPSELLDFAREAVTELKNAGHRAFCVGGCARDTLLGVEPREYDITTSATPEEVSRIFPHTVPIGASFGVMLVITGKYQFEVATFRKDQCYSDGRHPDKVIFSAEEQEDVLRRDFTINGMLYDPIEEKVIDYVDGMRDIEEKIVRTIGDPYERFNEDKLRMMRAIRFSSRYQFELDLNTFAAIEKLAADITQVSSERIRDEIVKIVSQKNPGHGLKMLSMSGLLKYVLPDVEIMNGVEQPPEFHPEGDVFTHTCLVLDKLYKNQNGVVSTELAMGALLHDVAKPPTFSVSDRIRFNGHDKLGAEMSKAICRELKFSNKQIEVIYDLIKHHLKFKDVFNMKKSTLKRFIGMPHFEEHMALHLADCQASHGMTAAYDFIMEKYNEFEDEEIKPTPLITGEDLIEMGYKPGPLFSKILNFLEEAQLEGDISTEEEAKQAVLDKYHSERDIN